MLLAGVGQANLLRVSTFMPELSPALSTETLKEYRELSYTPAGGDLIANGVDIVSDINQGFLGDCWFVAAIGAIAKADPSFMGNHVVRNANGSFTVTLYRDGEPVRVTVTADLPTIGTPGDLRLAYGGGSPRRLPTDELWLADYEKAFAQFHSGYANINGGHANKALPVITGQPADNESPSDFTLTELDAKVRAGEVLALGSRNDKTLWGRGWGDHDHLIGSEKLVSDHVYMVDSINLAANPPTITVVNPWGAADDLPADQKEVLTEAQLHDYFEDLAVTRLAP